MFESHVTVADLDRDQFISVCRMIGVKPVLIEADSGSNFLPQMMTAKFHKTDLATAKSEMEAIASHFSKVVRQKLEYLGKEDLPFLYREFHAKFEVPVLDLKEFTDTVRKLGGHSSQNRLKSQGESGVYCFATTREEQALQTLIQNLEKYTLVNVIREQVVYDSNPEIDIGWNCDCPLKIWSKTNN